MGLGARASCLLEVGCTHSGSHVLPTQPKHQAWSLVKVQAPLTERGLRSLRVQMLVTLQRISVSSSWCLRSIPTGSPRPSPPGNEKRWHLDRRPRVNLGLTSRGLSSASAAWVGFCSTEQDEDSGSRATCELGAAGRARAKGNAGSPSALGTQGPRSGDVTELLAQDPAAPEGRVQRCSGSRTFPPSGLRGRSPKKGDRAFRNGDACFWDPTQAARSQRKQSLGQPVDACP